MNCKRFRDIFDPSLAASPEVGEHLRRCRHCRAYADEMQKLQALLAGFPTIPVPGNFDVELSAKLAAAHTRRVLRRQGAFKRSFALAASLLVALAIGVLYVRYQSSVTLPPESRQPVAGTDSRVHEAGGQVEKGTEMEPETPSTSRSGSLLYAHADRQKAAPAGEALLPVKSRAETIALVREAALARQFAGAEGGVVLLLRDEESQEETVVAIPPVVFGSRPLIPSISKLVSTEKRGVL